MIRSAVARRLRICAVVDASARDITFDQGSRSSIPAGIEKLAATVRVTLGRP
jgi:hypothetical protein